MLKAPDDAMEVTVYGRMWNFMFEYEHGKRADTLYLPKDKPVKLNLVAMDVILSLIHISPMFYLGMMGMPRRYYDYLQEFHGGNILSTLGSWILATGFLIIIANLIRSARRGTQAEMNPWHGTTLEWSVSSPPPVENFDTIPEIKENERPYNY